MIERRGELRRLPALLAGRAGGLLVPAALSNQTGLANTTVRRYVDLLATMFLIKEIPAWSSGSTGRAIRTPKLAFVDTGLAAHLQALPFGDRLRLLPIESLWRTAP